MIHFWPQKNTALNMIHPIPCLSYQDKFISRKKITFYFGMTVSVVYKLHSLSIEQNDFKCFIHDCIASLYQR